MKNSRKPPPLQSAPKRSREDILAEVADRKRGGVMFYNQPKPPMGASVRDKTVYKLCQALLSMRAVYGLEHSRMAEICGVTETEIMKATFGYYKEVGADQLLSWIDKIKSAMNSRG